MLLPLPLDGCPLQTTLTELHLTEHSLSFTPLTPWGWKERYRSKPGSFSLTCRIVETQHCVWAADSRDRDRTRFLLASYPALCTEHFSCTHFGWIDTAQLHAPNYNCFLAFSQHACLIMSLTTRGTPLQVQYLRYDRFRYMLAHLLFYACLGWGLQGTIRYPAIK